MNDNVSNGYAEVLFNIAFNQNSVEKFYAQIQELLLAFENTKELDVFLNNGNFDKQQKHEVIEEIFGKDLDKYIVYWLWTIVDFSRTTDFKYIFKLFLELCQQYLKIEFVQVTTIEPLTKEQTTKLQTIIKNKYGCHQVEIENVIDQSLIAGMRIKIGTKTLDNSLISRLERLKRHTVGMKTIVGE